MKIHILGTGTSQGIPVIGCSCEVCKNSDPRDQRLRSCVVVEQEGIFLLIDTGPDLRQQMLNGEIPRVDAVLYTHEHNDHMIGLDDIRPFNFMQKADLPIYGLERVLDEIKKRFAYVFADDKYPGAPCAVTHNISGNEIFYIKNIEIQPINVVHGRLEILGYRIGKFAFVTDASYISDTEIEKLLDLDVLIINALRLQQHPSHFTLEEALDVIRKVNPRRAYITHVSHLMGRVEDWSSSLPPNAYPAYDGLVIEI